MIGSVIQQVRLQKGLTQAQLASGCGIPQPNLSNIEKGKHDLTVFTLVRIAGALGMKPAQLLEDGLKEKKSPVLTRNWIETLAEAVVDPDLPVSAEVRDLAVLFREILPETNPRGSGRKIGSAWALLKKRFSPREIRGIVQRVEDVIQRKP